MSTAIKVENLSKQYRLGAIGTGSIAHDLNRWVHRLRGKEDPYLKIGETNDRSTKGNSDYVWSLRDISFEIQQGDAVGIIGRNGAGKSTLLKILSRVTAPTTGIVKAKGRIASLLEVGTGFHPELTGRENIFLNGAILGMRKKEIERKFDEIVDFSGVERYIDTPVKRYSSGMYVRLAFAVAAYLESEILIVDEVLAVGDAEFQKKCLGKMGEVSKGEGRTVLFVSHNMAAVKQLCKKGLYLKNGQEKGFGKVDEILTQYKNDDASEVKVNDHVIESEKITLLKTLVKSSNQETSLTIEDDIDIVAIFSCKEAGKTLGLSFFVFNEDELLMFEAFVPFALDNNSEIRNYIITVKVPKHLLNSGLYKVNIVFGEAQKYVLLKADDILNFVIEETLVGVGTSLNRPPGLLRPKIHYDVS